MDTNINVDLSPEIAQSNPLNSPPRFKSPNNRTSRSRATSTFYIRNHYIFRQRIGNYAILSGTKEIQNRFQVTRGLVQYWKKKALQPGLHSGKWGGARNFKFSKEIMAAIYYIVWKRYKREPQSQISMYVEELANLGLEVSPAFISRLFTKWGLSFKSPEHKAIHKYTVENIQYYGLYLLWIVLIPWDRLHFLDEASYNPRDLRAVRILGPVNQPSVLIHTEPLDQVFNTTVFTTYSVDETKKPIQFTLRQEKNDSFSFLAFIVYLIRNNHLPPGHILILDNAKVHLAEFIIGPLTDLLKAAQVKMMLLPKYSPELNPTELVHGWVKNRICNHPFYGLRLLQKIILLHGCVTMGMMQKYYHYCLTILERTAKAQGWRAIG